MDVRQATATKNLPSNIDAERAILGAVLLENAALDQAAQLLKPDDFYLDSHRRLFDRMLEMSERSVPIDLVTLSEELMNKNQIEAVGGAAYLSSLTDGLPRLANIEHYVRIVRDKALLRQMLKVCDSVYTRCMESTEE